MSKTYRYNPDDYHFRKPKTKRERTQNEAVETDFSLEYDYSISKQNRRNRFIPTDWDDLPIGG